MIFFMACHKVAVDLCAHFLFAVIRQFLHGVPASSLPAWRYYYYSSSSYYYYYYSLELDLPPRRTSVEDKDPDEVCVGVRNLIMIIFLFTSFHLQKSHRSLAFFHLRHKEHVNIWRVKDTCNYLTMGGKDIPFSVSSKEVKHEERP